MYRYSKDMLKKSSKLNVTASAALDRDDGLVAATQKQELKHEVCCNEQPSLTLAVGAFFRSEWFGRIHAHRRLDLLLRFAHSIVKHFEEHLGLFVA